MGFLLIIFVKLKVYLHVQLGFLKKNGKTSGSIDILTKIYDFQTPTEKNVFIHFFHNIVYNFLLQIPEY